MTNLERLEADIRVKLPHLEYGAMLNNVLEWLGKTNSNWAFTSTGVLRERIEASRFMTVYHEEEQLVWDLKSVYLKDQTQELIDYLVGLI